MSIERHAENERVQPDNRAVDDCNDNPNGKTGKRRDCNQGNLVLPEPDQFSCKRQVDASPHGPEAALRHSRRMLSVLEFQEA